MIIMEKVTLAPQKLLRRSILMRCFKTIMFVKKLKNMNSHRAFNQHPQFYCISSYQNSIKAFSAILSYFSYRKSENKIVS